MNPVRKLKKNMSRKIHFLLQGDVGLSNQRLV